MAAINSLHNNAKYRAKEDAREKLANATKVYVAAMEAFGASTAIIADEVCDTIYDATDKRISLSQD